MFATDGTVFQWVILPLLIFLARICDVSLDTVRIILMSKGRRGLVPILGFFQALIWLLAIRQVFLNLSNGVCYFAFAGGFAMGSYVGMLIEERLAIGFEIIRIITRKDASALIENFKAKGIGVTVVAATGATGQVDIIYTVVNRKKIKEIIEMISCFNPKAFYTIENVRLVKEGVFVKK